MSENAHIDNAEVAEWLRLLHQPGDVFEIRCPKIRGKRTDAGFFNSFDAAAAAVVKHDSRVAPPAYYVTLNAVAPASLAKSANRISEWMDNATGDAHVLRRRWLFIDVDPKREGGIVGICASEPERQAAIDRAEAVRDWLMTEHGWAEPIEADSGNGRYLLFPIDLQNDDDTKALCDRVLKAIAARWSGDSVEIDEGVFNASRILRIAGTWNRKGDSTPDRPHRKCALTYTPDYLTDGWADPMPRERLESVAAMMPTGKPKPATRKTSSATNVEFSHRLDVEKWLTARGVEFRKKDGRSDGRTIWTLAQCPFNPEHRAPDACVMQDDAGKLGAKCLHNSCADMHWEHFRDAIGKPDDDHFDPPLTKRRRKSAPAPAVSVSSDSDADHAAYVASLDDDGGDRWTSIKTDEGRTDLAFARRFLAANGDNVQWVPEWSKWIIWDGTRWQVDVGNCGIVRMATAISDSIWAEVASVRSEDAIDYAQDMSKPSRWNSALKAAAVQRTVPAADLNANGWLLNCPNGTVDLRTGELRAHRKEDHITTLCPTEFHENATSATWDSFLSSLFDDDEIVSFLRRLIGYTITGDVSEQVMPILFGTGSNGKSTFLNALLATLGTDYAIQGRAEMLMARKGESHPTELADLHGRRFVSCVETDDGRRLAEGLVKQLTGGERVRARRLYEDFWEFQPTHKVYLCTNHKPEVRGTDHAIWRRLVLVPFERRFWNPDKGESGPTELRQDKTLADRLAKEAPGILAWAVRGCLEWRAGGLRIPESVRAATREFRSEQDVISEFIRDACLSGMACYSVKASDLYAAFVKWCESSNEHPIKQRRFGVELTTRGFERYTNNGTWYRNIALRA